MHWSKTDTGYSLPDLGVTLTKAATRTDWHLTFADAQYFALNMRATFDDAEKIVRSKLAYLVGSDLTEGALSDACEICAIVFPTDLPDEGGCTSIPGGFLVTRVLLCGALSFELWCL